MRKGAESKDPENACSINAASRRSHQAASRELPGAAWRMTHRRDPSTRPHPGTPGLGFAQDDSLGERQRSQRRATLTPKMGSPGGFKHSNTSGLYEKFL